MIPQNGTAAGALWLARVERKIADYRATKRRQLLQRLAKFWRRTDALHRVGELETPPDRIH